MHLILVMHGVAPWMLDNPMLMQMFDVKAGQALPPGCRLGERVAVDDPAGKYTKTLTWEVVDTRS